VIASTVLKPLEFLGEKALGRVRATLSGKELARLEDAHPLLGTCVREAAEGRTDALERVWFARIEALRTQMLASTEEVALIDFGTGRHNSVQDTREMSAGRHLTRTVRQMCGASKSPLWAELMFRLIRRFRPTSGLELGTCLGVSAAYQAAAMELNAQGHLTTCEGAPAAAERSRRNLETLGLSARVDVVPGRFDDTLDGTVARIAPVDWVFIDGHHDDEATRAYFARITPALSERAVVVFDDISSSAGMERAWRAVSENERVTAAVDLGKVGVTLLERGQPARGVFRVRLG
jgi:predicted O-methyltransferase YrrM